MRRNWAVAACGAALSFTLVGTGLANADSFTTSLFSSEQSSRVWQQGSYTVGGTIIDSSGKPFFFSGLQLIPVGGGTPINYSYVPNCFTTGAFKFENVPNGLYRVHFYMPEYHVLFPQLIVVFDHSVRTWIMTAEKTYSISATVVDSAGHPIAFQNVVLQDSYGNIQGNGLATNQDGSFTLAGVADGTYTLMIGFDGNGALVQRTNVVVHDGNVNLGTISG